MPDDLIFKTIRVDAVASDADKVTLTEGETRYSFFKKTQGGEETRAYAQYRKLQVEEGQEYPIAYKENRKEGKFGKEVVYRNIAYFAVKEAGEGKVPTKAENPVERKNEAIQGLPAFDMGTVRDLQTKVDALNLVIANFRTWAKAMENRVEALETLLTEIRSKDAIELHQATAGTSKTVQQIADELEGELDNEGFPRR